MYVSNFLTTQCRLIAHQILRTLLSSRQFQLGTMESVVGFVRLQFFRGFLLKETFTIRASMSTRCLWSCAHVQQTRKSFIICCTRKKR